MSELFLGGGANLSNAHCFRTRRVAAVSATTELKLSEQRYSVRRVQAELASQGERYDVKTIGAIMQRQSLVPKAARKFKVTVDSNHGLPVSLNLLEQNRER